MNISQFKKDVVPPKLNKTVPLKNKSFLSKSFYDDNVSKALVIFDDEFYRKYALANILPDFNEKESISVIENLSEVEDSVVDFPLENKKIVDSVYLYSSTDNTQQLYPLTYSMTFYCSKGINNFQFFTVDDSFWKRKPYKIKNHLVIINQ